MVEVSLFLDARRPLFLLSEVYFKTIMNWRRALVYRISADEFRKLIKILL